MNSVEIVVVTVVVTVEVILKVFQVMAVVSVVAVRGTGRHLSPQLPLFAAIIWKPGS